MKRKICSTCLWWWDLYDTGTRKCYRDSSQFYHECIAADSGCEKHESLMRNRKELKLGEYKKKAKVG